MKWSTNNEYKTMTSANKVLKNVFASSCGSACGAGEDEKPKEKPPQLVAVLVAQVNKINHLILK